MRQLLAREYGQVFLRRLRRVLQAGAAALGGERDRFRREVGEVIDELVGMLGFKAVGLEHLGGEVAQIVGHDHVGPGVDRGRQDVAVIGIGQVQARDQRFVAVHEAVAHVQIHQLACALELDDGQVRPLPEHVADPLVMDGVGPLGPETIGQRQLKQQVPQRRGVKDTGIVKGRERHGPTGSIALVELLRLLGQFIQRLRALGVDGLLIVHQILEQHPAMGADLAKQDFPLVEQADEEGAGNLEQVRRLLGGQFGMDRDQGDGVSAGHFGQ